MYPIRPVVFSTLLLTGLLSVPGVTLGASLSGQVCAAGEATEELEPEASARIEWNNGTAGFEEQCATVSLDSATGDGGYSGRTEVSQKESIYIPWGGCNTSDEDAPYEIAFSLDTTVTGISNDFDEKTEFRLVSSLFGTAQNPTPQTYEETIEDVVPAGVCIDGFFQYELNAKAISGAFPDILGNSVATNGLFFDPNAVGHGFDFNLHEYGVTVYYYGHTADGERLWLVSELFTDGVRYNDPLFLEMRQVAEGTFGQPGSEDSWGTLAFTFLDCNTVDAVLRGPDGELRLDLVRLVGLEGESCE